MGNEVPAPYGDDYSRTCTGAPNPVVNQLREELGTVKEKAEKHDEIVGKYRDKFKEYLAIHQQMKDEYEAFRKEVALREQATNDKLTDADNNQEILNETLSELRDTLGHSNAKYNADTRLLKTEIDRLQGELKQALETAESHAAELQQRAEDSYCPYSYMPTMTLATVKLSVLAEVIARGTGNFPEDVALVVAEYCGIEVTASISTDVEHIGMGQENAAYLSLPMPLDLAYATEIRVLCTSYGERSRKSVFDADSHTWGELGVVPMNQLTAIASNPKALSYDKTAQFPRKVVFINRQDATDYVSHSFESDPADELLSILQPRQTLVLFLRCESPDWSCHAMSATIIIKYMAKPQCDHQQMTKGSWLQQNPNARIWTTADVHQELVPLYKTVEQIPYREVPDYFGSWDPAGWEIIVHSTQQGDTLSTVCAAHRKNPVRVLEQNSGLLRQPTADMSEDIKARPISMADIDTPLAPDQRVFLGKGNAKSRFLYTYKGAVEQSQPMAMFYLSQMYREDSNAILLEWEADDSVYDSDHESIQAELSGDGNSDTKRKRHLKRHIAWLKMSADGGYPEALYTLGTYYEQNIIEKYLDVAPEYVAAVGDDEKESTPSSTAISAGHRLFKAPSQLDLMEDELDSPRKPAGLQRIKSVRSMQHDERMEFWLKHAAALYKRAAERGHAKAAERLAQMYMSGKGLAMNYKQAIAYLIDSGVDEKTAKHRVALHIGELAKKSSADKPNKKACLQYASMLLYGVGVELSLSTAETYFTKAGKTRSAAKKVIEKRFQSLKPRYQELWADVDSNGDNVMGRIEFREFYKLCLQAMGKTPEQAHAESVAVYQGKAKADHLYRAMDTDHNNTVDFDEFWSHPHTHTSLVQRTGDFLKNATNFFSHYKERKEEEARAQAAARLAAAAREREERDRLPMPDTSDLLDD